MATFQFLILHSVAPRHSSNGRRVPGIRRSCICSSLGFSGDENYTPGMKKIVPCNVNKEINNVWLLSNVLRRSWLYHRDRSRVLIQTVIEHFCLPANSHCSSALLQCSLPVQLSGKSWRFWLHCHGCHHALMLTVCAKTHPGGKVVSTIIIFCFLMAASASSIRTAWSSRHLHQLEWEVD